MTEEELSGLYMRLALQFDSTLDALLNRKLVLEDMIPDIRKKFYDSLNEERLRESTQIRTFREIVQRYVREMTSNSEYVMISLTNLARQYSNKSPGYVIQSWMRSWNTLEFLRQWELSFNDSFNDAAYAGLLQDAHTSSLTVTPSLWVKRTNAIGMVVKQGKGGGVRAYPEIAADFRLWLDPSARLIMVSYSSVKNGLQR